MTSSGTEPLLEAYLRRIGVPPPGGPTLSALRRLHAAHAAAIPFENLDILLGRAISLDLDHLRAKLVDRRRGGYCFEQNTLFLAVLRELGFAAIPMEARVRMGSTAMRPRTHMALAVEIDGEQWLADVGFGGDGPLDPVRMQEVPDPGDGLAYRVVPEEKLRVLQMRSASDWMDLYAFLPESVYPIDFELANWFTSTHPQSPFLKVLTAQRSTRSVRHVLRYPDYSEVRGNEIRTRPIDRSELLPLLRDVFLIELPGDTRFAVIDDDTAGTR